LIGNEIKNAEKELNIPRSDFFLSTKVPPHIYGHDKIVKVVEGCLKSLNVEYLDLMLLLWPSYPKIDKQDTKNIELRHDSWKTLEECVEKGMIKSIGVSNF
jgi:diketogulonate reductase-like aldo/keto reductase